MFLGISIGFMIGVLFANLVWIRVNKVYKSTKNKKSHITSLTEGENE